MLSVDEARTHINKKIAEGVTIHCPVCDSLLKRYRRYLDHSKVRTLKILYDYTEKNPTIEWVHIPNVLTELKVKSSRGGDFAKLRFWGLVEPHSGSRLDGSKRTGLYKITELGKAFVREETKVPAYIYMYQSRLYDVDEKIPLISFNESLDIHYDHKEQMK